MNHSLVPKHEILSEKEAEELLKTLKIKKENLPKIKVSDPVIRLIKGKVGDIVKITRKSLTAGEAVVYRVVVEG